MSVAILIEFGARDREPLYIPVATEGEYATEWVEEAERLGLRWLPLFQEGCSVATSDLPAVVHEIQRLRANLIGNSKKAASLERMDYVLEQLRGVVLSEISRIFIG